MTTSIHPGALDEAVQPARASSALPELRDPALPGGDGPVLPSYDPAPITTHWCLCDEDA